jgi:hypothetical protein
MNQAITISGSRYIVTGTVKVDISNNDGVKDQQGVLDLQVLVYDSDDIGKDDFLGIGVTNAQGIFSVSFDASQFRFLHIFDRSPDLYFVVNDGGYELLNTKNNVIQNANESTAAINLTVDLSGDKLRTLINTTAVSGWIGGFMKSNPAFAYPTPDLSSLPMLDNLANIPLLQRQQKVVWPEFSWETEPGETDPKRCYQMFAPDISRLGYTDEGRVYSIICPQQGYASPTLGSFNVEVTVTGNRGWSDETNRELAADMSVVGKIWFGPRSHENKYVKLFMEHFKHLGLPFPSTKANAIEVTTHLPDFADQVIFPLTKGSSTNFPIPDFAKHDSIAWSLGHLAVQIGPIQKTGSKIVDDFNEFTMSIFNAASGNMLKNGNILTWNVWFTAPEHVDQEEWAEHAEKWRLSIDADHGSPDGEGTIARHFNGTPFQPSKELLENELPTILDFIAKHI